MPADNAPLFLATSLIPGRDRELQNAAVASWKTAGFTVLTVNGASEADAVKAAFPDVECVIAAATAERFARKPVPYIHDLLKALRAKCDAHETPARCVAGIINADIFFRPVPGLADLFRREAQGAVILGPRVDVTDISAFKTFTPTGSEIYSVGYDYFLMSGDLLADYDDSLFSMGMPFWDYWLPLVALLHGRPLKALKSPVALHVGHDTRWDSTIYLFFHALVNYVLELCAQMKDRDTSPEARRYDLMADLLSHIYSGIMARGTKPADGANEPGPAGTQALADFYDRFQEVAVHHIKSRAVTITAPGA